MQQTNLYLLSFLIAFLVQQELSAQGQVVRYELTNTYNTQDVQNFLNTLNIPSSLIQPKFEVDVYRITYITTNAQNTDTTTATGMLGIPKNISCPMPLAAYHHGTTTLRQDVPSYGSMEGLLGVVLSSTMGYITSLPDYLGMGGSTSFHPYVHARSQATASVDLMRAIRSLKDSLGFNLNEQVFLLGYSQGGHATMATHKYIEENLSGEFNIAASIPMSGPYDISGAQSSELFNSGVYASPAYLPYVIMGYQEAYGNIYQNLSDVFVSPYDTMIPRLYNGNYGLDVINRAFPSNIIQILQPAFYDDFVNNPNNPMRLALADNDVYDWTPQAPTRILYCMGDEQVFAQNSIVAYNTMIANGATQVTIANHGNYTHGGCLMYALIDGFNTMNSYADFSGGINIAFDITPASGNQNNGAAIAEVSGGDGQYVYNWYDFPNNNSNSIENVNRGAYLLNIKDGRGCYTSKVAIINHLVGVETIAQGAVAAFRAYPNPAKAVLVLENNLDSPIFYNIKVVNTLGQVVKVEEEVRGENFVLNISDLHSGIYFVELSYDAKREIFKILIED